MPISNADELNDAVRDLGSVNQIERTLKAECDAELALVKKRYAELMVFTRGEQTLSTAGWRLLLESELEQYCVDNEKTLLPGKEKSIKLTAGVVGFRKGRDTLKPIDGDEKGWLTRVVLRVRAAINTALEQIVLAAGLPASSALKVSFDWDKSALMKLLTQKAITKRALKAIGFEFVAGVDKFYCDPDEVIVEAQSANAA